MIALNSTTPIQDILVDVSLSTTTRLAAVFLAQEPHTQRNLAVKLGYSYRHTIRAVNELKAKKLVNEVGHQSHLHKTVKSVTPVSHYPDLDLTKRVTPVSHSVNKKSDVGVTPIFVEKDVFPILTNSEVAKIEENSGSIDVLEAPKSRSKKDDASVTVTPVSHTKFPVKKKMTLKSHFSDPDLAEKETPVSHFSDLDLQKSSTCTIPECVEILKTAKNFTLVDPHNNIKADEFVFSAFSASSSASENLHLVFLKNISERDMNTKKRFKYSLSYLNTFNTYSTYKNRVDNFSQQENKIKPVRIKKTDLDLETQKAIDLLSASFVSSGLDQEDLSFSKELLAKQDQKRKNKIRVPSAVDFVASQNKRR